jgi:TPP-dependent pyruvate/acetoin dehydrogenase alpha subunit
MNWAAVEQLPVIFLLEDNQLASGSPCRSAPTG